jgi:hypothetical protein
VGQTEQERQEPASAGRRAIQTIEAAISGSMMCLGRAMAA